MDDVIVDSLAPVIVEGQIPMALTTQLFAQHFGCKVVLPLETFLGKVLGIDDALIFGIAVKLGNLGARPAVLGDVA